MSAIRILRPKKQRSVSPATVLPTALLFHLFRPHSNYTVVLDDHSVGKIGYEQVKDFQVEPGEHRLYVRFVGLRRSDQLRVSLKDGEERLFLCGTSGMGWPTLREATPQEAAQVPRTATSEPATPDPPVPPNERQSQAAIASRTSSNAARLWPLTKAST